MLSSECKECLHLFYHVYTVNPFFIIIRKYFLQIFVYKKKFHCNIYTIKRKYLENTEIIDTHESNATNPKTLHSYTQ